MSRSECLCDIGENKGFACETVIEKINDDYIPSKNKRFRFVKDNGCITDEIEIRGQKFRSGITQDSIYDCQIRLTGHDKRSIANDHRVGKSHRQHFKNFK